MERIVYTYSLAADVPLEEARSLLDVAIDSVEALHGEAVVRLDVRYAIDEAQRAIVIDAGTRAGRNLNRLFVGLLVREYGHDVVDVERYERPPESRVIRLTGTTTN